MKKIQNHSFLLIILILAVLVGPTRAEPGYPVIQTRCEIADNDFVTYRHYWKTEVKDIVSRSLANLCCKRFPFARWVPYDSADGQVFDRFLIAAIEEVDVGFIGTRKVLRFYHAVPGNDKVLLEVDSVNLFPASEIAVNNDHTILFRKIMERLPSKLQEKSFRDSLVTEFMSSLLICTSISLPDSSLYLDNHLDKIVFELMWPHKSASRSCEFKVSFATIVDTTLGSLPGSAVVSDVDQWFDDTRVGSILEFHLGGLSYDRELSQEFTSQLRKILESHEPRSLRVTISHYSQEVPTTADNGLMTSSPVSTEGSTECAY